MTSPLWPHRVGRRSRKRDPRRRPRRGRAATHACRAFAAPSPTALPGDWKEQAHIRCSRPMIFTAVLLSLLLAACGGGQSTARVATGSSTTTASSSAGGRTQQTGLLAYGSCMRSHGVEHFPGPANSGGIPKETLQQLGVGVSQDEAAQAACKDVLPGGRSLSGLVSQTVTAGRQQDYINAAPCIMRSHGVTNFPDPIFSNGQVEFPRLQHAVDIHSTQFTQAHHSCQKLIPAGLPYSGPSES